MNSGNCMNRCGCGRDNDSVAGSSDRRGCGCGRNNDSVAGSSDRRGCGCGRNNDSVAGSSDRRGCGCGRNNDSVAGSSDRRGCGCGRDNDSVAGSSDRRGCGCGRDNDSVAGSSDRRGCGCGRDNDSVAGSSDRRGCGCRCGSSRDTGDPFVTDLADAAERNDNFRKVLWTGENLQLTLMCLRPGEDIGSETHCDTDQCLIIESGTGVVELGCGGNMSRCPVCAGSCVCIPAGTRHNLTNTGCTPLKLCSIYAPPEHERGAVQETKEANNCCRCRF